MRNCPSQIITDKVPCSDHDERPLINLEYTTPIKLLTETDFFASLRMSNESKISNTYSFNIKDLKNQLYLGSNTSFCTYTGFRFMKPKAKNIDELFYKNIYSFRYICKNDIIDKTTTPLPKFTFPSHISVKNKAIKQKAKEIYSSFIDEHYIDTSLARYAQLACIMISSYYVKRNYQYPYNDFKKMARGLDRNTLQDVYKQVLNFTELFLKQ